MLKGQVDKRHFIGSVNEGFENFGWGYSTEVMTESVGRGDSWHL